MIDHEKKDSQDRFLRSIIEEWKMSLLHRLPGELVHAVLESWLDLLEVTYLDSATCVKEERTPFLSIAYASCVYDYSQDFEFYSDHPKTRRLARYYRPEFQQWILLRNVRLSSLASYPKCERVLDEKNIVKKVIEATGSRLKTFHTHMDFDMAMVALRKHCPVLERLECGKGGKRGSVGKLLSKCPLLQHLIMTHTEASSVESMKKYGAQLRSLRMSYESYLQTEAPDWASLVPFLPNLTTLEVGGSCPIDTVLIAVAANCPHLRSLRLIKWPSTDRYRTDEGLLALAKGCPSLDTLMMEDQHFCGPSTLLEVLRVCKKLSRVQVKVFNDASNSQTSALSHDCPGLRELRLKYFSWNGVDTKLIEAAASWPLLETLQLENTCVTDDLMYALAAHCPRLQTIMTDDSHVLTDSGIIALAKGCRQLRQLDLDSCPQVTVAALEAIVTHCQCKDRLVIFMYASLITAAQAQPYLRFGDINHINGESRRRRNKVKRGAA